MIAETHCRLKGKETYAVIICGGEVLDYKSASGKVTPGAFVICADSGYRHCKGLGLSPSLLVGDFDSIISLPDGVPTVRLPADKDYTDTAFAATEAVDMGFTDILFIGIGGGRPDHTVANLQTMAGLSRRGIRTSATDGVSDMLMFTTPIQGAILKIPRRESCYFSVLAFGGTCMGVTITGAKYPLDHYNLSDGDPRAVSNEFVGGDALVTLDEGTVLIIITRE